MPWVNVNKPGANTYTNVVKPTGVATLGVGYYMGPLGLTYSDETILTNWINITKPGANTWTNVLKPT